MQNRRPTYAIESVDHALQLLLVLQHHGRLRGAEAAAELGVARSTAHRLLGMLRYRGFVTAAVLRQATRRTRDDLGQ